MIDIYKQMNEEIMICQNCKEERAEKNEFNYILCNRCLDYYMNAEVEQLIDMDYDAQDMYWRMYNEEHKRL